MSVIRSLQILRIAAVAVGAFAAGRLSIDFKLVPLILLSCAVALGAAGALVGIARRREQRRYKALLDHLRRTRQLL